MDEEQSKPADPSWKSIKQRARLLTPHGHLRPNLFDPSTYVFRQGIAAYQNVNTSEEEEDNSCHLNSFEPKNSLFDDSSVDESAMEIDPTLNDVNILSHGIANSLTSDLSTDQQNSNIATLGSSAMSQDHGLDSNCSNNIEPMSQCNDLDHDRSHIEMDRRIPQRFLSSSSDDGRDFGAGWWGSGRNSSRRTQTTSATQKQSECEYGNTELENHSPDQSHSDSSKAETSFEGRSSTTIEDRTTNLVNRDSCTARESGSSGDRTCTSNSCECSILDGDRLIRGVEERGRLRSNSHSEDDGRNFGAGWWCPNTRDADKSTSSSAKPSKKRNNSGSLNSNDASKRVKVNNSKPSKAFGSGWWKGRIDKPAKKNSKSECDSGKRKSSSTSSHCSRKTCASSKCRCSHKSSALPVHKEPLPVMDVVPYKDLTDPNLVQEFMQQVSVMKQGLIKEEENHGRVISTSLGRVPGLWRASLGGSTCSLLVKVVGVSSGLEKAVKVKDVLSHVTCVTFPFLTPGASLPGTGGDNPFILLRSVHWTMMKTGAMGIVCKAQEDVLIGDTTD